VFEAWEQEDDLNGDGDTGDRVLYLRHLASRETTNLGLAVRGGGDFFVANSQVIFRVVESSQGEDLNGDGDREDDVLHACDLERSEARNLGLVASRFEVSGSWLVCAVEESSQGRDLNGDGDREDEILHAHHLERGQTTNLGFAVAWVEVDTGLWGPFGYHDYELFGEWLLVQIEGTLHLYNLETQETVDLELDLSPAHRWVAGDLLLRSGDWLGFLVAEPAQGRDVNGDGDAEDDLVHLLNVATGETRNLELAGPADFRVWGDWLALAVEEAARGRDLNGDGDAQDRVLQLHDLSTGETTDIGLAAEDYVLWRDWLLAAVAEAAQGKDLNGDGDREDSVYHVVELGALRDLTRFVRGDATGDGSVDISDAVSILAWLFLGDAAPGCRAAADANGDGAVDVSDPLALLSFLFLGGPPPPPPFPDCGARLAAREMDCRVPPDCP
jgi:hypothetical protein